MGKDKQKYINFPIELLDGFLINSNECLNNVLDYGIYENSQRLSGDLKDRFLSSAKYFEVDIKNVAECLNNGRLLFEKYKKTKSPKVGISTSMIWDYYGNQKSEFEEVCLLGFLALKSIIQNKAFCKITNNYWLSRMDGKAKTVNGEFELSQQIRKYVNRYHSDKVKTELQDNWGLKYYSRFTRGFYVSFEIEYDELVYQAEKRRKSTLKKQRDLEKKIALDRALAKLNATTS